MGVNMKLRHQLFNREYSSEELCDVERDVSEALSEEYNLFVANIPKDEHGFHRGAFEVSIVWIND